MGRRERRNGEGGPEAHTVLISDPATMWEKLAWDIYVFRKIQAGYPTENQPLAYTALNACIAAASLADWAKKSYRVGNNKKAITEKEFEAWTHNEVPHQRMCEDIANTAKHGRYGGTGHAVIEYIDGDEDFPPAFILYHSPDGTDVRIRAIDLFDAMKDDWWRYLVKMGLVTDDKPASEWFKNEMLRIFGQPPAGYRFKS
jgi:hypothetical protein